MCGNRIVKLNVLSILRNDPNDPPALLIILATETCAHEEGEDESDQTNS